MHSQKEFPTKTSHKTTNIFSNINSYPMLQTKAFTNHWLCARIVNTTRFGTIEAGGVLILNKQIATKYTICFQV